MKRKERSDIQSQGSVSFFVKDARERLSRAQQLIMGLKSLRSQLRTSLQDAKEYEKHLKIILGMEEEIVSKCGTYGGANDASN